MPCHGFKSLDSAIGGSPVAQFNPGGYETKISSAHFMERPCLVGDLGMTSLNSWESLLHLLLPPNHAYFPLPQEMDVDFCTVVALSSLTSQAELFLSLFLFNAVREAGLQLCRLRARLSGHLASGHCSGDTLVLQGCLYKSSQEGPGITAGGTRKDVF